MNEHHVTVARAIAAMSTAVGAVPGCNTGPSSHALGATSDQRQINLHVTGRSPSLHRQSWYWSTIISLTGGDDVIAACAVDSLKDALALQHERAADGIALGYAHPLVMNEGYAGMEPVEIGHLGMDRATLAIRLSELPSGASAKDEMKRLQDIVRAVHREPTTGDKRTIRNPWATITDLYGRGRQLNIRTPLPLASGRSASYDGKRLTLPAAALPDTVMTALQGRPLGDLVAVHPLLDGRTIRRITPTKNKNGEPRLRITLDSDRILIGDALDADVDATAQQARDRVIKMASPYAAAG